MQVLKEDCRKCGRLLKRVDVLISDLQPYAAAGVGPAQEEMLLALQVRSILPPEHKIQGHGIL